MGRPSKLTEKQWAAYGERLLKGEKPAALAKEAGVDRSAFTRRFAQEIATVKHVANQVVSAEVALKALPVAQQIQAVTLIDRMRAAAMHLTDGVVAGAETYSLLSARAVEKARVPSDSEDDLKLVMALQRTANAAAEVPMAFIAANKPAMEVLEPKPQAQRVTVDVIDASLPDA
jgi:hypothetical protein